MPVNLEFLVSTPQKIGFIIDYSNDKRSFAKYNQVRPLNNRLSIMFFHTKIATASKIYRSTVFEIYKKRIFQTISVHISTHSSNSNAQ